MIQPAAHILGPDGPIARQLGPGFEPRPQQIEMALAVANTMATRSHLIVEAGTGVGKSFAYLVPAMLRCLTSGDRVVICTHTIALQEQIIRRDIPFLMETIDQWGLNPTTTRALVPALVKGRGNYVSLRRLEQAARRQDKLFADAAQRRSLAVIQNWSLTTDDGTLASMPPLERPGIWDRVQSDTDNCMGRKCPRFDECFYQKSRRAMEAANLLVCNHAVFFADLSMRRADAGFLPPYQHVVLDEAHTVEDVACDHFGLELTEARVEHLLNSLFHSGTGRGYLSQLSLLLASAGKSDLVDDTCRAVDEALGVSRAFFDEVLALLRSGSLRNGRMLRANLVSTPLAQAMRALAVRLKTLREATPGEADKFELNAYSIRAEAIAFDADVLVAQASPGYVYWAEGAGGGEGGWEGGRGGSFGRRSRLSLACSPIDVAPLLRQHLFEEEISVVLTSATLATGKQSLPPRQTGASARRVVPVGEEFAPDAADDTPVSAVGSTAGPFAHLATRIGCDKPSTLLLGSPFDHAAQTEFVVDTSVPSPRATVGQAAEKQDYARRLAARVLHHIQATGGGAFVLFTSFDMLDRVGEALASPLARAGWPMLRQGADGTPGQILARFRQNEHSVLLGAASFWQGVDVKGRGLRNVIITRLPFEPPDRPLTEARAEKIRERGGDPFRDDALPRAILKFKQGFGRLIRSKTDTGRVVVLDPRITSIWYGRKFLEALPEGVKVRTEGPD